ncbi:MAG: hypothetical protein GYB68_18975 [Chloroflexi bacterium]|nr:hypothetical protein [Chloroflexota bacterium]
MTTTRSMRFQRFAANAALLMLALLVLAACNLGQRAPAEPIDGVDTEALGDGSNPTVEVQPDPVEQDPGVPTSTPIVPEDPNAGTGEDTQPTTPNEQIQSVTLEGTDFRTQEPITVRVVYGVSVVNLSCTWLNQITAENGVLSTPDSTSSVDVSTTEALFSFTPQSAGTYRVTCEGDVLTIDGTTTRVSGESPFVTVEAKG